MKTATSLLALALVCSPLAANDEAAPPSPAAEAAKAHIDRIASLDDAGPMLNAVIVYNPGAPALAAEAERKGLPLAGRTVLVKDNIETYEWPTTAGSLALADNRTARDAPMIAKLREHGGVVLGKTNLSEWANIRSDDSTSGWSAVGGLTRNPHATDRNSCGSSSGSGAAVAAGFAWAAIGTETNGSITCPASINGVVGFKPSVGLVSRTHVVPISSTQDTAGPMTQTVFDAALLLGAIAGEDSADPATQTVPNRRADYTEGLAQFSLEGVRIGVMRKQVGRLADVEAVFETALADLGRAGAVLVDIEFDPNRDMYRDSYTVLKFELREEMAKYLQSLPGTGLPRTLTDLIAFNKAHADTEMRWFGQNVFEEADQEADREAYETARANAVRIAGEETLDKLLADHDVQFLVAPTRGPTWTTDLVHGDYSIGGIGLGSPAAIAGYPHLTVPMGAVETLPIGLSIIGGKWQDHAVLKAGAAYERARTAVLPAPSFKPWRPAD
ncbi:amidase [Altererythrobacter arenosus]|uniref:Amidase n=1 Tax=Altererythrobacter arenosus TaxID=3032592 RepID=A0ABY8FVY2_9SPHN|nr:amidase [Altererythrobacter sp. CAU 1644]WFL78123.1 amidase [Altererythrobacter sp. CAU 1644]